MPFHSVHRPAKRRLLVAGATFLILSLVLYVGYRDRTGSLRRLGDPPTQVEHLVPRPVTIAPGLFLLGGLEPAVAYVVETPQGLVLIDSGIEPEALSLKKQMKYLKLDWRSIQVILLTHAHADHSSGAQHLRSATGARIYAGEGDAAVLRAGQPREAFFTTFAVPEEIKPVPTAVDVALRGGESFEVGDVRFRVLATPGHTPGSTCYLAERGDQRVLFSGDVIQSLASTEKPSASGARLGTYTTFLAPRYRGDACSFLRTLRALRQLSAPDLVLPGHPRHDPVPQDPSMTPQRWEALLDAGIHDLEQLLARYAEDGANFLDDVPKKLLPDFYYLGDREGVAVYGFFASSHFFLVNAPGGGGLREFVNGRLGQLGLRQASPSVVLLTSGNAAESSGIADLLAGGKCSVVASPAVREAIRDFCPAGASVIELEELTRKKWLEVQPILASGRDFPSVNYLVRWQNKAVLISGRFPIKSSATTGERLSAELKQLPANVRSYALALDTLRTLKPDLWLPAYPGDGQNANLYGGEWTTILAGNEVFLR